MIKGTEGWHCRHFTQDGKEFKTIPITPKSVAVFAELIRKMEDIERRNKA